MQNAQSLQDPTQLSGLCDPASAQAFSLLLAIYFWVILPSCILSHRFMPLQSSDGSYEDSFKDGGVSARLQAFPRPGQSKADSKLQRDFQSKVKLDASKGWSNEPWKTYVPGKELLCSKLCLLKVLIHTLWTYDTRYYSASIAR